MSDFEGLVAVVTGGASGIGAATARLLQTRGAQVAILDLSTGGAPEGVLAVGCDITDTAAVGRAVTAIASLASPAAASTTGAILRVDGGMTSLRH